MSKYRTDDALEGAIFDAHAAKAKEQFKKRIADEEQRRREKHCRKVGGHFYVPTDRAYIYRCEVCEREYYDAPDYGW